MSVTILLPNFSVTVVDEMLGLDCDSVLSSLFNCCRFQMVARNHFSINFIRPRKAGILIWIGNRMNLFCTHLVSS